MRLQAVVDTAAQVTLVSEDFYKSLDPAPPIHREVVMNTAGKGMQMNGFICWPFPSSPGDTVLSRHLCGPNRGRYVIRLRLFRVEWGVSASLATYIRRGNTHELGEQVVP